MTTTAIVTAPSTAIASITDTRKQVSQMVEQRLAIVEAMQKVMKAGTDYGIVPGCDKPSLWKPGSEKILSMFHLAPTPTVEDLSTPDCIRYRVHVAITHAPTGAFLGTGVGEASSAESKYQWRAAVCVEEWNETPEDRRRTKWKKGKSGAYSIDQVRSDMEDVANTVLKMAKKRAQIDATLTATAASDVFGQDLEELKELNLDSEPDLPSEGPAAPAATELPRRNPSPAPAAAPTASQEPKITESQGKQFWAAAMKNHGNDYKVVMDYIRHFHGVERKNDILASRWKEAITWAETPERTQR